MFIERSFYVKSIFISLQTTDSQLIFQVRKLNSKMLLRNFLSNDYCWRNHSDLKAKQKWNYEITTQDSVTPVRWQRVTQDTQSLNPDGLNLWLSAHSEHLGGLWKALFPLRDLALPIPVTLLPSTLTRDARAGITESHTVDSNLVATRAHLWVLEGTVPRTWLFRFGRTSRWRGIARPHV